MYSKINQAQKKTSGADYTQTSNRFAAPKFFVQPQLQPEGEQQQVISKAEMEKIQASDSNWPDVSMFTTNRPAPAPRPRVQMKLKLGQQGDKYEQKADQVAEKVVSKINTPANTTVQSQKQAETAQTEQQTPQEDLQESSLIPQQTAQEGMVQLAPIKTNYGTFNETKFDFVDDELRVHMELEFTPNDKADATKVGLVQSVKTIMGGNIAYADPNRASKSTPEGYGIDQIPKNRNPLYATESEPRTDKDKLESYATDSDFGQHAEKKESGWTPATLIDRPSIDGGINSSKEFETTALAIEGNQKGTYYGSVKWGYQVDAAGDAILSNLRLESMGVPSQNFMDAAKKWNEGKTGGTLVPKADGTKVYDKNLKELFTIDTKTELIQLDNLVGSDNNPYVLVEFKKVPPIPITEGYIKVQDLTDIGDGKETVDLPIVENQPVTK
ncbi:MAG TPA: hypothetical protein VK203_11680 [Nostocaceae cyanobacterium]|nr:hypothetical protein [Nostocaceae cyanobacterium]